MVNLPRSILSLSLLNRYTQRFFSELQNYLYDFQEFQEFFYLARQTAADLIIEHRGGGSATKMDVVINRPVVIVPGNSFSTDAFEANLGNTHPACIERTRTHA